MSRIYTRSGDGGSTTIGANRVHKFESIVDFVGTLDELNAHIGLVSATVSSVDGLFDGDGALVEIQEALFHIGAYVHQSGHLTGINVKTVEQLESHIDRMTAELPELKNFILPRGRIAAAHCFVAASVCRRLERCLWIQHDAYTTSRYLSQYLDLIRSYLNRLSDYLFVKARHINHINKVREIVWTQQKGK